MPTRFLTIGDSAEMPEDPSWRMVCTQKVNMGYDTARLTIPVSTLRDAGANLMGILHVTWGNARQTQFVRYVDRASLTRDGTSLRISSNGWGHVLRRTSGVVKTPGLPAPEIAYNVAIAAGLDASGVEGYDPSLNPFRVTKAVSGLHLKMEEQVAANKLGPVLGSDEASVIKAANLKGARSTRDVWPEDTIVSTDTEARSFWEAMSLGGPRLFETIALVQYQWLSGSADRFAEGRIRFAPYWRAPKVGLSDTTLARRLDAPLSLAMSRPRVRRRSGSLSNEEIDEAIQGASNQLRKLSSTSARRRRSILNAMHLFVRATEAPLWSDALLFYSCAADEIVSLAPRDRTFGKKDRKSMLEAAAAKFGKDHAKYVRIEALMSRANQRTFKEGIRAVAAAHDVRLSSSTLETVDDLYEMRNDLVHAGRQPSFEIVYAFAIGLSALDQIISKVISSG
jgi:hypothetical protein